jgi:hypothetical protein
MSYECVYHTVFIRNLLDTLTYDGHSPHVYCSLEEVTRISGDSGHLYTETGPRRRTDMDKLIGVFQFSYS